MPQPLLRLDHLSGLAVTAAGCPFPTGKTACPRHTVITANAGIQHYARHSGECRYPVILPFNMSRTPLPSRIPAFTGKPDLAPSLPLLTRNAYRHTWLRLPDHFPCEMHTNRRISYLPISIILSINVAAAFVFTPRNQCLGVAIIEPNKLSKIAPLLSANS